MVNEKLIGAGLIIVSFVVSILYFIWVIVAPILLGTQSAFFGPWQWIPEGRHLFPVPPLYWAIIIPLFIALLVFAVIFGWIGSALVKSPSPPEISAEEIEAELEEAEEGTETETSEEE